MAIQKIMCFCGSGLGTSFILEMNTKKALEQLGITGVEVVHSTIDDVMAGTADLFLCSKDLLPNAKKAGKAIGLENMLALDELKAKLQTAFAEEEK